MATLCFSCSVGHQSPSQPWDGHGDSTGTLTHLAPSLVVVQVHERPGILLDLPGIHKDLGEADAVADVSRAAAPFPALLLVVLALLLLVAAAVAEVALRAGCCDGVGHAGRNDGIGERGLPAPCKAEQAVSSGQGMAEGNGQFLWANGTSSSWACCKSAP